MFGRKAIQCIGFRLCIERGYYADRCVLLSAAFSQFAFTSSCVYITALWFPEMVAGCPQDNTNQPEWKCIKQRCSWPTVESLTIFCGRRSICYTAIQHRALVQSWWGWAEIHTSLPNLGSVLSSSRELRFLLLLFLWSMLFKKYCIWTTFLSC